MYTIWVAKTWGRGEHPHVYLNGYWLSGRIRTDKVVTLEEEGRKVRHSLCRSLMVTKYPQCSQQVYFLFFFITCMNYLFKNKHIRNLQMMINRSSWNIAPHLEIASELFSNLMSNQEVAGKTFYFSPIMKPHSSEAGRRLFQFCLQEPDETKWEEGAVLTLTHYFS